MPDYNATQMTRHTTHTILRENEHPEAEIEQLLKDYYPYILCLARSIVDDPNEADDIAQDTFIAAHRSLHGFRHEASPKTWLTTIAINKSRGKLRKRKFRQALNSTLQAIHLLKDPPASPEHSAIQNEVSQNLWKTVDGLDEKHRLPVILRYVHELSVPEIATVLNLNQGTVHSRLHYARQELCSLLGHLNPHQEAPDEIEG